MPETNPASPRAAPRGASGKGLWKSSGGDTGGGRTEATRPLAPGTHWAASLGPTWCSKRATSPLALHFPHFSKCIWNTLERGQAGLENVWVTLDVGGGAGNLWGRT